MGRTGLSLSVWKYGREKGTRVTFPISSTIDLVKRRAAAVYSDGEKGALEGRGPQAPLSRRSLRTLVTTCSAVRPNSL